MIRKVAWITVAVLCFVSFLAILSIGAFILIAACVATALAVLLELRDSRLPIYALAPRALLPAVFALSIGVPVTINRMTSPYCDYSSGSAEPAGCTDTVAFLGPGLLLGVALIVGALVLVMTQRRSPQSGPRVDTFNER